MNKDSGNVLLALLVGSSLGLLYALNLESLVIQSVALVIILAGAVPVLKAIGAKAPVSEPQKTLTTSHVAEHSPIKQNSMEIAHLLAKLPVLKTQRALPVHTTEAAIAEPALALSHR